MEPDLASGEIHRAQFRTTLRGFDPAEVTQRIEVLAGEIEKLREQRDRLTARLGEYADRDLVTEFDEVGREVASVLQAAREAAETMRQRASLDAAQWRAEAMAVSETTLQEARSDAEALRGDAWATGTELLNQTLAELRQLRQNAERDVLTVMGEAEREAHRLTSSARREAEEAIRVASMDAEKISSQATKRHDEIIEQAHRAAEAAQERTLALEERREELLEELEHARATLNRLETTLEERREGIEHLPEPTSSVKVIGTRREPESPPPHEWEPGETVRVIQRGQRGQEGPEPLADEVAGDVARIKERSEPEPAPEPAPEPEPAAVEAEPVEEEAAPEPEPEAGPVEQAAEAEEEPDSHQLPVWAQPKADDVGALFASLRGGAESGDEAPSGPVHEEVVAEAAPEPRADASGWIEEREARLLPISNRALRGVKKAVTEAQNIALDSLRTDETWGPDGKGLADAMRADLIGLWAESYAAGHAAAEEMTGERLKRPETPQSEAADSFGAALADAIDGALSDAGPGLRERQSAASRVFRGWRTDEAERRIREMALRGYHSGITESVGAGVELQWVSAGIPCSKCSAAATEPAANLPPIHAGCSCTLVAV
jgi:cell division septum initiation protein DivIVA